MNILLRPNLDKPDSAACTEQAVRILLREGATPMLDISLRDQVPEVPGCMYGNFDSLLKECDLLLAIGGDGTMLHTVPYAVRADKPLAGVNIGRVGFLTQIEGRELERLALVAKGAYTIQPRMLLEVEVPSQNGLRSFQALNDVIFSRNAHQLTEIGVYAGDRLIVSHRADGLIFATPTGSTGYSLSAGGSVVDPALSAVLLTAICPFTAYNRSLVLSPTYTYTVRMEEGEKGVLKIFADGAEVAQVQDGQEVRVRCSDRTVRLIDLGLRDFYQNLREKIVFRR